MNFFPAGIKIILASRSPRRKKLLFLLSRRFNVIFPDDDSGAPGKFLRQDAAMYYCRKKAQSVRHHLKPGNLIITADTIVCLGKKILGKPRTTAEAGTMLQDLSGRKHEVFTAVSMETINASETFYVRSEVLFRKLDHREITEYVNKFRPFDKAGAYGLQELMPAKIRFTPSPPFERVIYTPVKKFFFIKEIKGSYTNVMGLPLKELFLYVSLLLKERKDVKTSR
ncbi:MAG: Maf family protein [Bacteroidetes bacterium]|nr:Maf family protein [Bacteroidota bacterium]